MVPHRPTEHRPPSADGRQTQNSLSGVGLDPNGSAGRRSKSARSHSLVSSAAWCLPALPAKCLPALPALNWLPGRAFKPSLRLQETEHQVPVTRLTTNRPCRHLRTVPVLASVQPTGRSQPCRPLDDPASLVQRLAGRALRASGSMRPRSPKAAGEGGGGGQLGGDRSARPHWLPGPRLEGRGAWRLPSGQAPRCLPVKKAPGGVLDTQIEHSLTVIPNGVAGGLLPPKDQDRHSAPLTVTSWPCPIAHSRSGRFGSGEKISKQSAEVSF